VREKLIKLAALAADDRTPEHERAAAALVLAKLLHARPELIGASSAPPLSPGAELDPLVGAVVREAVAAAGDLVRDFLSGRERAKAQARAPRPSNVQRCPICQAAVIGPPALAGVRTCGNGHRWTSIPPKPAGPPEPARPGPRKARAARARRA
jgi:hypothetical protein